MFTNYKSIFYIVIFLFLLGCSKEESTQTLDPPSQITKSPKRGLAYDLKNAADLDTLKSLYQCYGAVTQVQMIWQLSKILFLLILK
ncbi:MAG: hypothetical protein H6Q27_1177 [Ignavibacteriaceae bacterium]|nr:hypothetical protein [Ignavibacteriaceae bacterium]